MRGLGIRRLGLTALALLALGPALRAQDRPRGPTPRERLEAIAVPPEVAKEIRAEVHALSYHQRQGSAALIRRVRRDRLISEHGITAVPFLCEVLNSDRYWTARVAAQALAILARGEHAREVRWLAHYYGAPRALIAQFGRGPRHELAGLHLDLNAALLALLGEGPTPPLDLSHQADVRQLEAEGRAAQARWSDVWRRVHARWRAREEEQARARGEPPLDTVLPSEGLVPAEPEPSR